MCVSRISTVSGSLTSVMRWKKIEYRRPRRTGLTWCGGTVCHVSE